MNKICITKLIVPGSLISVRKYNRPDWYLNIVSHCSGEDIDIPFTPDLMKACLFVDTNIVIKYKNDFFEYIISGRIVNIELSGSPYVRINVVDIIENINHRIFPRQDVYLPATLSHANGEAYYCNVFNISLGGTALLLDRDLPDGCEREANIMLNDRSSVYCRGMILRHSSENSLSKYSMKFTFMDDENSNRLYAYLTSLDSSFNYLRDRYLANR